MCDTLCVLTPSGLRFAKNSDRPPSEAQIVAAFPRRSPSATPRSTQYLRIADPGAAATIGSQPTWLWGFEHGVNEHRVAIGNEKVWTVDDPTDAPSALIGMDLVRLGLERGRTADDALDIITSLIATHGQGGIADATFNEAYWSSFLIADPERAWILETSGNRWAAEPVTTGAAISNRIALRRGWTRASSDVAPGTDIDTWRDPNAPTAIGDLRLAVTRPCVAGDDTRPGDLAAVLRDHGGARWGAPDGDPAVYEPPPATLEADFTGISVCMHLRGVMATQAAMITEQPLHRDAPARAWFALGSPCVSVFVPAFPPAVVATELADPALWARFDALRQRVEANGAELGAIRAEFGPLERELWIEADLVVDHPKRHRPFLTDAIARIVAALERLGV
jgi:secernin